MNFSGRTICDGEGLCTLHYGNVPGGNAEEDARQLLEGEELQAWPDFNDMCAGF